MSADTREILTNREVIAIDQDAFGQEATRTYQKGGIDVFTRFLSDGGYAVAVFNRNAGETPASFTWEEAGITAKAYAVRDLWRHADIPVSNGYGGTLPGHGVVVLHLKLIVREK